MAYDVAVLLEKKRWGAQMVLLRGQWHSNKPLIDGSLSNPGARSADDLRGLAQVCVVAPFITYHVICYLICRNSFRAAMLDVCSSAAFALWA